MQIPMGSGCPSTKLIHYPLLDDRVWTDLQHAGAIPYAAAIEGHLNTLALHLRDAPTVRILPDEGPSTTGGILTAKPVFAIRCRPIFHYFSTLTVRTPHHFHRHLSSPLRRPCADWASRGPEWQSVSQESTNLRHYPLLLRSKAGEQ